MSTDIVERLRCLRYIHLPQLSDEAAAEIERLRHVVAQKNLTDAERSAIALCVEMAETTATECDEEMAALRGLLARFK
jgi:hypothetical protein